MGKTRDLFKKIRDTKEIFHVKMGSIKDRNGMDLTEAEDIKKRWQEYTEEQSRFLCNIALYSIRPCFYHQSHPQLTIVFALAPSLHSF